MIDSFDPVVVLPPTDTDLSASKKRQFAEECVRALLHYIGEDPDRDGLKETPARVIKSYAEMFSGYTVDVKPLFKTFDSKHDEMVVLHDVEFYSMCEHHMLPFFGTATIGYLPASGRIIGVSKLARLIDAFAHRLQVQERLTQQITDALYVNLNPLGAGCVIKAKHLCMACRGVRKDRSTMITSTLVGVFREKPEVRQEFLALAGVK
jgi:GTP cyclohydrolase I